MGEIKEIAFGHEGSEVNKGGLRACSSPCFLLVTQDIIEVPGDKPRGVSRNCKRSKIRPELASNKVISVSIEEGCKETFIFINDLSISVVLT